MITRISFAAALVLFAVSLAFAAVPMPDALKPYPVYKGGTVVQSMNTGQGVFVMVELPEGTKPQAVMQFFKEHFLGAGWNMVLEVHEENGGGLSFSKGNEQIMITVDTSGSPGGYSMVLSNQ